MGVHDGLLRRILAELNSVNKRSSYWDLVEGRHCSLHRDAGYDFALEGRYYESSNAGLVVAVEGRNCFRDELRLWIGVF